MALFYKLHCIIQQATTLAMPVQHIQCSNEKLMCILLLIASQVTGVGPNQVQQFVWDVWSSDPWVKLCEAEKQWLYLSYIDKQICKEADQTKH